MKIFKLVGVIILAGMLGFSCAGTEQTKVEPPVIDDSGNHTWVSKRIDECQVTIDSTFTYVGEKDRNEKSRMTYHVWSKDNDDEFIYLIDWRHNSWSFPKGADTLKPRSTEGLLKYEPNEYTIWNGISPKSNDILLSLGVDTPKNKVVVDKQACMNKWRNKVVWVIYGKIWDENHTDFERILEFYNDAIK